MVITVIAPFTGTGLRHLARCFFLAQLLEDGPDEHEAMQGRFLQAHFFTSRTRTHHTPAHHSLALR